MQHDQPQPVLRFDDYQLDLGRGCLRTGDREIDLRPKSFSLLAYLVANAGRLVSKVELMDAVWPKLAVSDDSLAKCVSEIRIAVDDADQRIIQTVPRRGYIFAADVVPLLGSRVRAVGKPSVAILPFDNLSGDKQEYFVDGIADDIITSLSRSRSLFVIARNSSFVYKGRAIDVKHLGRELGARYLLAGSARGTKKRIKVNAQLVDSETGHHLWVGQYDRKLTDLLTEQDEIAIAVTRAIEPTISVAEQQRARRQQLGTLDAWENYQRGRWYLSGRAEDVSQARNYLHRALELDPLLARAHMGLAVLHNIEGVLLGSRALDEALALAAEEARKAIAIDPTDAEAHAYVALAAGNAGDFAQGFDYVEQALQIHPNCAFAHQIKGWLMIFSGRPAEGREAVRLRIRLDPWRRPADNIRCNIATSYYFEGDYENAACAATRLAVDHPNHPWAHRWVAAALGQLGRIDEAHAALDKAMAASANVFNLHTRQRPPYYRGIDHDHMLEGLRKAGWLG